MDAPARAEANTSTVKSESEVSGRECTNLFAVVVYVNPLVHHRPLHDVAGGLLAEVALGGVRVVLRETYFVQTSGN